MIHGVSSLSQLQPPVVTARQNGRVQSSLGSFVSLTVVETAFRLEAAISVAGGTPSVSGFSGSRPGYGG